MRVLGLEGTAWMASAAVFDTALDTDSGAVETAERGEGDRSGEERGPSPGTDDRIEEFHDRYTPTDGGIHPREAAEHMGDAIPAVVGDALDYARETESFDGSRGIDAVAFSRGPGLGPCLRITGTAARAVAAELDVPLIGVNHMLAHLEIGRHRSGFERPVCLNASGANAHLLGYHAGRYRVLGETMDTGVGNTLDKFARSVGWSHPGGPKVEAAAREGDYYELPYVVKGMDFSFAGLASAAEDAVESGVPVEDICAGLQEHVFGMLTEVSERALALTGADELVLGGGVGQNDRLREMLNAMCAERGASFYAPEPRFLRDNASMIAVLGAKMAAAGATVAVSESAVDPGFRPDEVPVTWRDEPPVARVTGLRRPDDSTADGSMATGDESGAVGPEPGVRGAEATVTVADGEVIKRRPPKAYRHPTLDDRLRRERTVQEARLLAAARKEGVPTPLVREVDTREATLRLSFVGDRELADAVTERRVRRVGRHLARLHAAGIVHGDPTTRNVRVDDETDPPTRADAAAGESVPGDAETTDTSAGRVYLIDFGLGYYADHVEDLAMDLHVFEGSLRGTVESADRLVEAFEAAYRETEAETAQSVAGDETALERLREIEGRGRYQ